MEGGFPEPAEWPTHTPTVSGFTFLECFALAEDTVGFFRVWVGMRAIAAVSSVQRLRMTANANFIVDPVTLVLRVCGQG